MHYLLSSLPFHFLSSSSRCQGRAFLLSFHTRSPSSLSLSSFPNGPLNLIFPFVLSFSSSRLSVALSPCALGRLLTSCSLARTFGSSLHSRSGNKLSGSGAGAGASAGG